MDPFEIVDSSGFSRCYFDRDMGRSIKLLGLGPESRATLLVHCNGPKPTHVACEIAAWHDEAVLSDLRLFANGEPLTDTRIRQRNTLLLSACLPPEVFEGSQNSHEFELRFVTSKPTESKPDGLLAISAINFLHKPGVSEGRSRSWRPGHSRRAHTQCSTPRFGWRLGLCLGGARTWARRL